MIREATLSDIPVLLAMGERFAAQAGFGEHMGYDPETVAELLGKLIELDEGILLVGDRSMVGAVLYAHPFNAKHLTAQELFWWSESGDGKALLAAMETQARALGADTLVMSCMDTVSPDRMAKFYARQGFRPLDRNYVKVF